MSCIHAFVLQCDCNLHHRVRTLGCCLRSILRPSDGCIGRYLVSSIVAMNVGLNVCDDWLRRERFVFLGWSGVMLLPTAYLSLGGWFTGISFVFHRHELSECISVIAYLSDGIMAATPGKAFTLVGSHWLLLNTGFHRCCLDT